MKFFFDTEFIERGSEHPISLISIGMVAENGQEFYRENLNAPLETASDWVKENVIPRLSPRPSAYARGDETTWRFAEDIRAEVRDFVERNSGGNKPEFWGYYADYDWVCLCQLFGAMIDLPKGWPMYCRDIKQWCDDLGNPRLPGQRKGEHNALSDARWNKTAWDYLKGLADGQATR